MANVRRFFRYDVEIPIHFELVESEGISLHARREQLIDLEEEARLQDIDDQLDVLIDEEMNADVKASELFYNLNHRINFMAWMLDKLMLLEDPKDAHDYKFRIREDNKLADPHISETSKIGHLIEGFNTRLNLHILELVESIQNSIDNKVFIFPRPVNPIFESITYVTNLEQLAQKGVVPAKVLVLLIEKLNIWEKTFTRLKIANRVISDPEAWTVNKINLSAGGFSLDTEREFGRFAILNVFMKLGDDILISRGKLLSSRELIKGELNKIAIEFEFLSVENAEKITLFVQQQEIRDAIKLDVI